MYYYYYSKWPKLPNENRNFHLNFEHYAHIIDIDAKFQIYLMHCFCMRNLPICIISLCLRLSADSALSGPSDRIYIYNRMHRAFFNETRTVSTILKVRYVHLVHCSMHTTNEISQIVTCNLFLYKTCQEAIQSHRLYI